MRSITESHIPCPELAFTVSGTQYIKVQTFEDQIAENDETVRLELHDPETGRGFNDTASGSGRSP